MSVGLKSFYFTCILLEIFSHYVNRAFLRLTSIGIRKLRVKSATHTASQTFKRDDKGIFPKSFPNEVRVKVVRSDEIEFQTFGKQKEGSLIGLGKPSSNKDNVGVVTSIRNASTFVEKMSTQSKAEK